MGGCPNAGHLVDGFEEHRQGDGGKCLVIVCGTSITSRRDRRGYPRRAFAVFAVRAEPSIAFVAAATKAAPAAIAGIAPLNVARGALTVFRIQSLYIPRL